MPDVTLSTLAHPQYTAAFQVRFDAEAPELATQRYLLLRRALAAAIAEHAPGATLHTTLRAPESPDVAEDARHG